MSTLTSANLTDLTGQVKLVGENYFAHGNLADLWMGDWDDGQGHIVKVAVKLIRGAWLRPTYLNALKEKLVREGKVWSTLIHPNVTPIHGISYDLDLRQSPCLVCPFYSNGDLCTYLVKHPEADRMKLVSEVAAGLAYLHRLGVVHGDIKSSNILVNDKQQARLTDFGLSRILETSGFTTKTVGGTCRWMSYELINYEDEDEGSIPKLTLASDVWAFGMTVIEILTGHIPFYEMKYDSTVILAVMKGKSPTRSGYPEISDTVWAVLQRCWDLVPANRPSMGTLALIFDLLLLRPLSIADVEQIFKAVPDVQAGLGAAISRTPSPAHVEFVGTARRPAKGKPTAQDVQAYPCHWPSCARSFPILHDCQTHEAAHFDQGSRRRGDTSNKPSAVTL